MEDVRPSGDRGRCLKVDLPGIGPGLLKGDRVEEVHSLEGLQTLGLAIFWDFLVKKQLI